MKPQVTELLRRGSQDDRDALDQLIPLVHAELLQLARGYMARKGAYPHGHGARQRGVFAAG